MGKIYTADFETTTDINDCRVWAYAICEVGNPDNFIYGNSIEDFMKILANNESNDKYYFHNLKFDGEFIFSYILNQGFEYVPSKKERKSKSFSCIISDTGQFYQIEIYFKVTKKHTNKVTILDSLKLLNFSVDKIAKDFKLPINKLSIDYKAKREVGHILTPEEIAYIRNDVEIMARALKIMFDEGLSKMTIGSNALSIYKEMNQRFDTYFPVLPAEVDKDIRRSYKGGFTYLNPLYKEKEVGYGNIYDVNSLYPSVMYYENMPIGNPEFFNGEYKYDPLYPLYIVTLSCSFKLKKGKIPTIQLKRNLHYLPTEYIETTNGDIETFTLTNIDLELFLSHYDVEDLMYHSGWKFKSTKGLFCSYIDMYTSLKINSKKEGNGALYLIAKLMLNSLYGKFGLNPEMRSKYPYLKEDGVIGYHLTDKEIRDSVYIPVATFITSYARRKTITTSQKIRDYSLKTYGEDYYIYSDTDSIHCRNLDAKELEDIIDIDKYKLGAWDNEAQFTKGKYIRQKCYIEHIVGKDKINVTIAGFPKNLAEKVTFDNFNPDFSSNGKLAFKHVKGGIVLVDTTFTIKR